MSRSSIPQFYNLSLTNNSADSIDLAKQDDVFIPLLEKASDYRVSVLKFSFPSENETFIMEDTSEYRIIYSINAYDNLENKTFSITYPLFNRDKFKINNINDLIENFNRTSVLCHKTLLDGITEILGTTDLSTGNITKTFKKTVNVTGISDSNNPTQTVRTLDFSTNVAPNAMLASIEVTANFSRDNRPGLIPYPICLTMQLTDNANNTMIVFSNKIFDGQTVLFTDGSINTQTLTLPLSSYTPEEPFNKLIRDSTGSSRGNWTLTIINKAQLIDYNYNVSVKLLFSPKVNLPIQSTDIYYPRIAHGMFYDQNKKSVSLLYDENVHRSGFTLSLSPKLYNIMPFFGERQNDGNYTITIPQDILSDTPNILKINQYEGADIFSAYKMIDLQSIILKTTLPVAGEFQSDSIDRVLMSLDISSTDLNSSYFEFVNNSIASRSYQLLSDLPLRQIGISVFLKYRSTGAIVPAKLPPFTTFSMLLKFIPNDNNF
jgi:hypothetical protein